MSTTETPNESLSATTKTSEATNIEQISNVVKAEFQVDSVFVEHGIPMFYVQLQQDSKQAFLRLIKNLAPLNLMPVLRRQDDKIVLSIVTKPQKKPSKPIINILLFLATLATTFATGYYLSLELVEKGFMSSPFIGAIMFSAALLAVLGAHEMGHTIAARKHGIEATPPYFIPGPPPIGGLLGIGTFGAVIIQKDVPPNKDALFDMGASGPIIGFIITIFVTLIGLALSPATYMLPKGPFLPLPLLFIPIEHLVVFLGVKWEGNVILLHPIAFAGFIGMIVTMLNLLPTGTLDGGHVAKCLSGDRARIVLTVFSIVFLVALGYWPMAFLVLFLSMYKHPGPLEDVSKLSLGRKLVVVALIVIFAVCGITVSTPVYTLKIEAVKSNGDNLVGVPFCLYYAEGKCYSNQTPYTFDYLAAGNYMVSLNLTVTIGGKRYQFDRWEMGKLNGTEPVIPVKLSSNILLRAFYHEK